MRYLVYIPLQNGNKASGVAFYIELILLKKCSVTPPEGIGITNYVLSTKHHARLWLLSVVNNINADWCEELSHFLLPL